MPILKKKTPIPIKSEYKTFIVKLIILAIFIVIMLFLYKVSNVLIALLFSIFLNILFSPLLNRFNSWKIPNVIGIIIIYILIALFVFIAVVAIIPIFVNQFSALISMIQDYITTKMTEYNTNGLDAFMFPEFIKSFIQDININEILTSIKENIGEISSYVGDKFKLFLTSGIGIISTITNMLANFFLVFVFTFFIALERKKLRDFFFRLLPNNISSYLQLKEPQIINSISHWFKSQALLGLCIFTLTLLGLNIISLFGVTLDSKYTLALIAGMMEFVPYLGPILSAVPAIVIALGISYKAAIVVAILYIIIQELENNLLVPYIMGKSLSLSPFAVLIAMTIGASLFGIVGIIIAVPIVAVIQIFVKDYLDRKK